ncbi:MAG TPA: hypothetical protein VMU95_10505 [Trebonia sp.]|nr:hypothetical protein [Trebonia sp.]
MDEEALRAVLTRIAADPEPPPRIDIDEARRRGRRRLLRLRATQVAAGPLAIALTAGLAVTVPHAVLARTQRSVPSAPAARSSAPKSTEPDSAPTRFNPLVPYAAFGLLPAGFSEGAVSQPWTAPFESGPASLTLAAQNAAGRTLFLTVGAKGNCPPGLPRAKAPAGCEPEPGGLGTSRAPGVNGRPAWYTQWGSSISWEYAPGAWATLDAGVSPDLLAQADSSAEGSALVRAAALAEEGWVVSPTAWKLDPGGVASALKDGKLIPPSPQTMAMLRAVASSVKFGQKTPVVFPFLLSGLLGPHGAAPAGWQLTSVSFWPSRSRLVGRAISAGPAAAPSALSVRAAPPDGSGCDFVAGLSTYVTRFGVSWIEQAVGQVKAGVTLCSTGASPAGLVDGLQVFIEVEAYNLPGFSSLGGPFGVFARMKFLGGQSAGWTTDPLGVVPTAPGS